MTTRPTNIHRLKARDALEPATRRASLLGSTP